VVKTDRKLEQAPLQVRLQVRSRGWSGDCEQRMVTRAGVPDAVSESNVMSARQWQAQGVSPALLRSLVRSGQLVRMRQGVYATKRAMDWSGADPVRAHVLVVMAATATVGRNAVASYQSAALLHRLSLLKPPPDGSVALTLPLAKPWNRARPADVVFHASDLPPEHVTRLFRLPVTTAARTVADLARTLPLMDAVVVTDSALNQEKATKPELLRVMEKCAGWPGVKQARQVIDFADERAESPLESAARVVFEQRGLDSPELQATIHGPTFAFRVDFLWRGQKVIAEADGLVKYNDRKDLLAERERDHLLGEAGYTVVHFTWQELFQTPEAVVDRIRKALAAAEKAP
jgi:very-short-patch-repair endonuclease